MKNNYAVVAVVVLGVFFAGFPERLGGQAEDVSTIIQNARDVDALKSKLFTEDEDLGKMEPALSASELHLALEFNDYAEEGVLELRAVSSILVTYDRMQCASDKQTVKEILKKELASYSLLLGVETDGVSGYLGFATLPANAVAGTRIRDDLRAGKNKLDEINAALN